MKVQIVLAATGVALASFTTPANTGTGTEDKTPEARCERMGYAERPDKFDRCLSYFFIVGKLDEAIEIEPLRDCIENPSPRTCWALKECANNGPFGVAHCTVFFTRVLAGESIDEQSVKGFIAMMEAKDAAKAQIVERCRRKVDARQDEELDADKLSECIVADSVELYGSVGGTANEYYEYLLTKKSQYYKSTQSYFENVYDKFHDWWHGAPDASPEHQLRDKVR